MYSIPDSPTAVLIHHHHPRHKVKTCNRDVKAWKSTCMVYMNDKSDKATSEAGSVSSTRSKGKRRDAGADLREDGMSRYNEVAVDMNARLLHEKSGAALLDADCRTNRCYSGRRQRRARERRRCANCGAI